MTTNGQIRVKLDETNGRENARSYLHDDNQWWADYVRLRMVGIKIFL